MKMTKWFSPHHALVLMIGCLGGLLLSQNASAGLDYWRGGGGDSDWATAANWSTNGIPTAADNAYIGSATNSNSVAQITLPGAQCVQLYLGYSAATTGTVTMSGGNLLTRSPGAAEITLGNVAGSSGTFIQNGGIVSNFSGTAGNCDIYIGGAVGSSGSYELNGGTNSGYFRFVSGYKGTGSCLQTADSMLTNIQYLVVGNNAGSQGTYTMNGGSTLVNAEFHVGSGGTGTFTQAGGTVTLLTGSGNTALFVGKDAGSYGHMIQNGGTVTNGTGARVYMANLAGASGVYELNGGELRFSGGSFFIVGQAGNGTFIQNGGTNYQYYLNVGFAAAGCRGSYLMSNGYLNAYALGLGSGGYGSFTQYAGQVVLRSDLNVGNPGGTGTCTVIGGTMVVSNTIQLGAYNSGAGQTGILEIQTNGTVNLISSGTFRLGNFGVLGNPSTGTILMKGGILNSSNSWIYVRYAEYNNGTIQGYGTINSLGLQMGGRVIADGYGVDRTLFITNGGLGRYTPSQTGQEGWYAQNHGRLQLTNAVVTGASPSLYWGCLSTSTDLVNAVKLSLSGVSGIGSNSCSLYALDHIDVPAYTPGVNIAGIWRFVTNGFTMASCTALFRYDSYRVTNTLGISENALRVYQYNGSAWVPVSGANTALNTANKWLTASNVTSLGWFAVAESMANLPPTVNAGTNQTILVTDLAQLRGTAADTDSLPSGVITTTWSRVSGSGTVTFGDLHATNTTASFSTYDTYILRLTVTDGDLTRSSDVTITVNPGSGNTAPVANPGTNQTVTLRATATLKGSVTDDGLPSGVITSIWSQVSGPGPVSFGDVRVTNTTVTFTLDGVYVLQLWATDSQLSHSNTMTITVTTPPTTLYWDHGGADSNWTTAANWTSDTKPVFTDTVYAGYVGYVSNAQVVLDADSMCYRLSLGESAGTTGTLTTAGANLTTFLNSGGNSPNSLFVGNNGAGRVVQNGGIVSNNMTGSDIGLGYGVTGSGEYDLNGGQLAGAALRIGYNGQGTFVQSPGTVNTLSSYLVLANNTGSQGTYTMSGGVATVGTTFYVGAGGTGTFTLAGGTLGLLTGNNNTAWLIGSDAGGYGHVVQNGGTVTNGTGARCYMANNATASGLYELNGGELRFNGGGFFFVGSQGRGTFVQNGGTNYQDYLNIGFASAGCRGSYLMSNGYLNASMIGLGSGGYGSFTQYAGQVVLRSDLNIGNPGGTGTYTVIGGTLVVSNAILLGAYNSGAGQTGTLEIRTNGTVSLMSSGYYMFKLGSLGVPGNPSSGTILMKGGTLNSSNAWIHVRFAEDNNGTIQGWGTINSLGLQMGGRVIADGFGEDHSLVLTNGGLGRWNLTQPGQEGWYAQNHGKLQLAVTNSVSSSQNLVYWGDVATYFGGSSNLVNAAKLNFSGVSGVGTVAGSLYATNHTAVPKYTPGTSKVLAIWEFNATNFTFSSASLTFRYDLTNAVNQGIQEANLKVYQHNGDRWLPATTFSVNPGSKTIVASNLTALGFFGVAETIQSLSPGTIMTVR